MTEWRFTTSKNKQAEFAINYGNWIKGYWQYFDKFMKPCELKDARYQKWRMIK